MRRFSLATCFCIFLACLPSSSYTFYLKPSVEPDFTSKLFFYTNGNHSSCVIHSGSIYEALRCLCTLHRYNSMQESVLNQRLHTRVEKLLSRWLIGEGHETEEDHEEGHSDALHTYKPQCEVSQYFNLYGDLIITYEKYKKDSDFAEDCGTAKLSNTLYLPDHVNATYIKRQLLYWRSSDIKTFIVMCSIECTAMLLNAAEKIGINGDEYTWIVHFMNLAMAGASVPNHLLVVVDEEVVESGHFNRENENLCHPHDSQEHESSTVNIIDFVSEVYGSKIFAKTSENQLELVAAYHNGTINFNSKASKILETFPHKHALPTRNIRVVTIIDAPFTMIHEHSEHVIDFRDMTCANGKICYQYEIHNNTKLRIPYCCLGHSMDLLDLLERDLHLIPEIYIVEDNAFGQVVNGSWVGLVGDVVAGKADLIVASISINAKRAKYIDFTAPYMPGGVSIVVLEERKEKSFYNFEALEPLSLNLWLTILVSTFLISFVLVAMEAQLYLKNRKHYPWIESIVYLVGLVFQRDLSGKNPNCYSTRTIGIIIAVVMLVIMSTYTAVLTANKVTLERKLPVTGLEDPKMTNPTHAFKFGTLANSVFVQMFAESADPVWNRIGTFMNNYNYKDSDEGFAKLSSGELGAVVHDYYTSLHYMSKDCRLQIAGDLIPEPGFGLGLRKGSLLTNEVSEMIRKYNEDGKLRELETKWVDKTCREITGEDSSDLINEIGFKYFGGLFIVVIVWIGFAFMVLAIELFVAKYILKNDVT